MLFELATPVRMVVTAEVDEVVAPGSEGYFGVLPGHAAFLTTLGSGEVSYRTGPREHYLAVAGRLAEVRGDTAIILGAHHGRARQRAEIRLQGKSPEGTQEEIDYARALAALARALTRLQVASHAGQS